MVNAITSSARRKRSVRKKEEKLGTTPTVKMVELCLTGSDVRESKVLLVSASLHSDEDMRMKNEDATKA